MNKPIAICCLTLGALLTFGCGASPTGATTPPAASLESDDRDEAHDEVTPGGTALSVVTDDPVRASSVKLAGEWVAYDDAESRVVVVGSHGALEIAQRAQLGCIAEDDDRLLVATFERDPDLPISHLVLSAVDRDGNVTVLANPPFWPEPGAACAWIPGRDDTWTVATRAREASDTAPMDLWFVPLDGDAVPLRSGVRVPLVADAAIVGDGTLIVLREVADDPETGRTHVYRLVHAAADGRLTPMASGAPSERPLAVATEERTVVVSWLESHQTRSDEKRAQRPYADVVSTLLPRDDPRSASNAPTRRAAVIDPVRRDAAPELVFADGTWWALLAPEPYTLRGKSEPAPYRARAIRLDEGNAVARVLPEEVRPSDADGAAMVATGAPVDTRPGFAAGIRWTPRWSTALTTALSVDAEDE